MPHMFRFLADST